MEELSLCPGVGARKVQKIHAAFRDPLDPVKAKRKRAAQQQPEIAGFLGRRSSCRSSREGEEEPAADALRSSQ